MTVFKFQLEFLLRYRTQKEEQAMYKLAECVRKANDIECELQEIDERRGQLADAVRSLEEECVPAAVYTMYTGHRDHLHRMCQAAARRLRLAEVEVEKKRECLVAASIEKKTIARFKEKRKEEYNRVEALKEQKNLDELASIARSRKTDD